LRNKTNSILKYFLEIQTIKPYHRKFFNNQLIYDRSTFTANGHTRSYVTQILTEVSMHLIKEHADFADNLDFLAFVETIFDELTDIESICNEVKLQLNLTQSLIVANHSDISPIRSLVENGSFLLEHLPNYHNGLFPALSICVHCLDELHAETNDIRRLINIGKLVSLIELVHSSSALLWQIPDIKFKGEQTSNMKHAYAFQVVQFFIEKLETHYKAEEKKIKRKLDESEPRKNKKTPKVKDVIISDLLVQAEVYYFSIAPEGPPIVENDKWLRRMYKHAKWILEIKNTDFKA
jgi:hypothetical protein